MFCSSRVIFKLTKLYILLTVVYMYFSPTLILQNSKAIESQLRSKISVDSTTVNLIIAHPDDEVMFFAPILSQLDSFLPFTTSFNILCFSNGDADGLGHIRASELHESLDILLRNKKRDVNIQIFNYKDGMDEIWNITSMEMDIWESLRLDQIETHDKEQIFITFDKYGVSNHINHKSCNTAVQSIVNKQSEIIDSERSFVALYLNSYKNNIFLKYSSFGWETLKRSYKLIKSSSRFRRLIPSFLSSLVKPAAILDTTTDNKLCVFSTYEHYLLAYAAMVNGHTSQMVWYRHLWWCFSRLVVVNDFDVEIV